MTIFHPPKKGQKRVFPKISRGNSPQTLTITKNDSQRLTPGWLSFYTLVSKKIANIAGGLLSIFLSHVGALRQAGRASDPKRRPGAPARPIDILFEKPFKLCTTTELFQAMNAYFTARERTN